MQTFEQIYNNESIDFQSTTFFDELTDYFQNFSMAAPNYEKLETIIGENTNINVEIKDSGFWATSILMLGQNHVLFKDIFDQYKQYISLDTESDLKNILKVEKKDILKGTVDRKNSKVTGIFKKFKFTLWINSKDINKTLTAKECAAVTLHEVGHQFTTFEMLGEHTFKNYAIINSLKASGIENSNLDKKIYLAKCAKDIGMDTEHSKSLTEAKTKDDAYLVILDNQRASERLKSNITNVLQGNTYHTVNSEWAADDFAARHGAGEHIVTGLTKMIDQSSGMRSSYNVLSILFTYVFPTLAFGPVGGILASSLFLFAEISTSIDSQKHKRYDQDKERFSRIRNTLILKLRTGDELSKEQLKEVLNSINVVEQCMNKVTSETPFMAKFHDWIGSIVSKDMKLSLKQEQFQKGIEAAANNVLYEKSFKAKLASQ